MSKGKRVLLLRKWCQTALLWVLAVCGFLNLTESPVAFAAGVKVEEDAHALRLEIPKRLIRLNINGPVTQATAEYISRALTHLEHEDPQKSWGILLQVDTPGGSLEATRRAVNALVQSERMLVTWIGPDGARAGSAGVFFTLAAHRVAMAEATRLGAAHPVGPQGQDIQGDMRSKVENDTASWARSLAEMRGRGVEWAERSVKESATLTVEQAIAAKVADFRAGSLEEVLASLQEEGGLTAVPQVEEFSMTLQEQVIAYLSDPNLVYVLLLAGMFGVFIEFKSPGLILPGAFGVTCLALVFGVQALPMNGFAVLLLVLGGALLVLEIYVTSFGLLSLAGIASLLTGSFLLFSSEEMVGTAISPLLIGAVVLSFAVLVLTIGSKIIKAQMGHGRDKGPQIGVEGPVAAQVIKEISRGQPGKVFYDGTYWSAELFSTDQEEACETIGEGEEVMIVDWKGLTARVKVKEKEKRG